MIVSILTDPAVGGTFLTWSLHYLAGDTEYFSIKNNKIIQLPDNPLTGINAHNFKPNQPLNGKQVLEYITALKNQNTNSLNTIYFHNFLDKETPQESLVSLTQEASDKTIVISHTSNNDLLYFCRYASRAGAFSYTDPFLFLIDPDEQFNDFINHFFRESKDKFYSSSTS
jgi:hypothetical protein